MCGVTNFLLAVFLYHDWLSSGLGSPVNCVQHPRACLKLSEECVYCVGGLYNLTAYMIYLALSNRNAKSLGVVGCASYLYIYTFCALSSKICLYGS